MKALIREHKTAAYLSYAIGLIIVLLPFHALITTWIGSNTGHLDLVRIWKEILIAILAVPSTWLLFKSPELRRWARGAFLPQMIALYFIIHIALGIWGLKHHQVNTTSFIYALIINLRFLGFFLVCFVVAAYSDWLKRSWFKLLVWPSAAVIIFGLAQKLLLPYDFLKHLGYGPKTIPAYQTVDSDLNFQRIQSTLRGSNPLGAYFVLIIPAFIYIRSRLLRAVALAGALAVLYFSYSRSAWIGLVAALALFALWKYGGSKKTKEIIAICCAAILLGGLGVYSLRGNHNAQDTLFHTSSGSANVSSNAQRAKAIKAAFKDVLHNPLGRGPGTAGPASFRNTGHPARIAENYYLQIAQETGVLGALIFLIINSLIARELWLMRKQPLARLLLASLLGITLVNLVSHAWTDDTLSLLWWGLAGVTLASTSKLRRHKIISKAL